MFESHSTKEYHVSKYRSIHDKSVVDEMAKAQNKSVFHRIIAS
jgi:hypothetical protein